MTPHAVVSREEWTAARKAHLAKEKEFTRRRDELSAERRALPWVKIDKNYVFDGPNGRETLADLFGKNSQLIIYHFMFGPGWKAGCPGCSFIADHIDGANQHLRHHDVSLVAVSRAPRAEFEPYRKRMGWNFKWVSSHGSDFNHDFHVTPSEDELAKGQFYYNYDMQDAAHNEGEHPGGSVFYRNEKGEIFHTYSFYARGGDILIGAYNYLDMTPKGRNEETIMDWMKRHDEYAGEPNAKPSCCA